MRTSKYIRLDRAWKIARNWWGWVVTGDGSEQNDVKVPGQIASKRSLEIEADGQI